MTWHHQQEAKGIGQAAEVPVLPAVTDTIVNIPVQQEAEAVPAVPAAQEAVTGAAEARRECPKRDGRKREEELSCSLWKFLFWWCLE